MSFLEAALQGIEAADYFIRKMDAYERDKRYDDNQKNLVVQATRMFETGRISKAQPKAIIDQLPDTVLTHAEPVQSIPAQQGIDLNQLLKNVDPAMLAQLLQMLK